MGWPDKSKSFYLLILVIVCSINIYSQNIKVLVTGIRSTQGQLIIKVYRDNASFDKDNPFVAKKFVKIGISKGAMTVSFTLEPGTYGLALLDDENKDNEMNYTFLGIPEEGFGFSNYYLSGLAKPSFDLFKFVINKDQSQKITIKIRYM
jgi:uncharacterized protein (DUF2141 family)